MAEANPNTTDIEVPQTMQLDMTPTPQPIKSEESSDEPPVFKDEVREAIFAKRREQLSQEMIAQGLEPQSSEPEPPPEPVSKNETIPAPDPVVDPKQEALPEPVKTANEEEFFLNVYGQQKKYTKDEMIREAQKGIAASQIFSEGHRMRDEALQIANSIKQNLQPQPAAQPNPPQAPLLEKEKELAKRINYGSEEEQANALREYKDAIIKEVRGQAPALPPEQLVTIATQQAIAVIDARTEQETLKKEFADILSDQPIASAADVIANQLSQKYQAEGIVKSRLELFREAGTIARDKYLRPAPVAPVQPNPPAATVVAVSNDKLERKRAAPKPPAAANKIAMEPPPQYGVGVSSIVNKMRQARGQPVLN